MKLPWISRKRHEREMSLLHQAYSVSTTDLRKQLISIIEKMQMVACEFRGPNGSREYGNNVEIRSKMVLPKTGFYDRYFSPAEKEELFWHIAQKIATELKMQARSVSLLDT